MVKVCLSLKEKTYKVVGLEGGMNKVSICLYGVQRLWDFLLQMLTKQRTIWIGGEFFKLPSLCDWNLKTPIFQVRKLRFRERITTSSLGNYVEEAPLEGDVIIPASGSQHWWYSINGFRMNSFVCTLQMVPPQSDHLFSVLNIQCIVLMHPFHLTFLYN